MKTALIIICFKTTVQAGFWDWYSGMHTGRFWAFPRIRVPQSFWALVPVLCHPHCGKGFSSSTRVSCIPACAHCFLSCHAGLIFFTLPCHPVYINTDKVSLSHLFSWTASALSFCLYVFYSKPLITLVTFLLNSLLSVLVYWGVQNWTQIWPRYGLAAAMYRDNTLLSGLCCSPGACWLPSSTCRKRLFFTRVWYILEDSRSLHVFKSKQICGEGITESFWLMMTSKIIESNNYLTVPCLVMSLSTTPMHVLNTFREEDSITSLRRLFQCWITTSVKVFLLLPNIKSLVQLEATSSSSITCY